MSTLQQALDRMTVLASGLGRDANLSPVVDSDVTAYIVWPHAIRSAVYTVIKRGDDLQDLMQSHTIAFTSGVGVLPATVIREGLDRAIWQDRPNMMSLSFIDYQRSRFDAWSSTDYFAILGNDIYFKQGTALDGNFTGSITIFAPTLDALPSDPEAEMPIPDRLVEAAIMLGASVLRGEVKLPQLIEQYLKMFQQPKSIDMDNWND